MGAEKCFENKIKIYLEKEGCYFVKYFANRMTKTGVPDILSCVGGNFLAIEVKSSTGKPSELQIHNVKKINESGGFAVIVAPSQWDDLKYVIQMLKCSKRYDVRKRINEINSKFF